MCTKANRTLGFLRRNLYQCPHDVKEAAYGGLVRPILEYGSCSLDPKGLVLQQEIEHVWNRVARFVTSNYCFEIYMTGLLEKIKMRASQENEEVDRFFCTKV